MIVVMEGAAARVPLNPRAGAGPYSGQPSNHCASRQIPRKPSKFERFRAYSATELSPGRWRFRSVACVKGLRSIVSGEDPLLGDGIDLFASAGTGISRSVDFPRCRSRFCILPSPLLLGSKLRFPLNHPWPIHRGGTRRCVFCRPLCRPVLAVQTEHLRSAWEHVAKSPGPQAGLLRSATIMVPTPNTPNAVSMMNPNDTIPSSSPQRASIGLSTSCFQRCVAMRSMHTMRFLTIPVLPRLAREVRMYDKELLLRAFHDQGVLVTDTSSGFRLPHLPSCPLALTFRRS